MNKNLITYEVKLPPFENKLRKEIIDILTQGAVSSFFAIPSIVELCSNRNSLGWIDKYNQRKEIVQSARNKLYQIMGVN